MRFVAHILAAVSINVACAAYAHEYPVRVEGEFIDADTFDAQVIHPNGFFRFRLYCINAPESRGAKKSPEGVAIAEKVKRFKFRHGHVEVVGKDAFGRLLVWFTPRGWAVSLNEWLYRGGVPLYAGLTRREVAICEQRLE